MSYDPEQQRRYKLRHHYGITQEEYENLLRSQGNRCAICLGPHPLEKWAPRWHVDHDHKTGRVRGILCPACNLALSYTGDSQKWLKAAIRYLRSSRR